MKILHLKRVLALTVSVFLMTTLDSRADSIFWSGYEWRIKTTQNPMGPGPNLWSDSQESVWVDARGRLNLKIRQIDGHWHCAEILTSRSLGYGKYLFYLDSRVDNLDKNIAVGLFVHSEDTNELDIEFSKWAQDKRYSYVQYVVQPRTTDDNIYRTEYRVRSPQSTHGFIWSDKGVSYRSFVGHNIKGKKPYKAWEYTGDTIPSPGTTRVRLNLWLYKGKPPTDERSAILVVDRFVFIPLRKKDKPFERVTGLDPIPTPSIGSSLALAAGSLLPHNNFPFERNPAPLHHNALNVFEYRQDIRSKATLMGNNKIGMPWRDLRPTDPVPLQTGLLNQPSR